MVLRRFSSFHQLCISNSPQSEILFCLHNSFGRRTVCIQAGKVGKAESVVYFISIFVLCCCSGANMSGVDVFLWTAQTLALGVLSLLPLKAICKNLETKPQ